MRAKPRETDPDARLMVAVQRGDTGAFDQLFDRRRQPGQQEQHAERSDVKERRDGARDDGALRAIGIAQYQAGCGPGGRGEGFEPSGSGQQAESGLLLEAVSDELAHSAVLAVTGGSRLEA